MQPTSGLQFTWGLIIFERRVLTQLLKLPLNFFSQILQLVHSLSFCVVEEEVSDTLAFDELERPAEEYN